MMNDKCIRIPNRLIQDKGPESHIYNRADLEALPAKPEPVKLVENMKTKICFNCHHWYEAEYGFPCFCNNENCTKEIVERSSNRPDFSCNLFVQKNKCRCFINARYKSTTAWRTGKLPLPCPLHENINLRKVREGGMNKEGYVSVPVEFVDAVRRLFDSDGENHAEVKAMLDQIDGKE